MSDPLDGLFGDLPSTTREASSSQRPAPQHEQSKAQEQRLRQKRAATAPGSSVDNEQAKEMVHGPEAKRAREKEGCPSPPMAVSEPKTLELHEALQKITRALTSPKLEKSRKAMGLLTKLLTAEMNTENASQFHAALGFFMASEGVWERLLGPGAEDRALAHALLAAVRERILLFEPSAQYRAASWILVGLLRPELLTDDTFAFRRAARRIREYVTALEKLREGDTLADRERRKAILACLRTALKQNFHSWAKASIEELFKATAEKRLCFPEEEREELDEMATKLRTEARGLSVNPSGTVVSRSVRMVNSMATPFNTKKGDVFR
ncbi:hypothetical protein Naga_100031g4 [Nannochloropsis gaditana]|uniref:Uncharacterized protein n=1 Tax=Nannochloropsis gaditana TaxID=72520 RepID=W7TS60_9STRA|nr:hypothetical protein Naga_100031g4 [Nannochloropsis gaditana]